MAHHPQHSCLVLLVKRILRINEEKPPVLFMGMFLPQESHRVNPLLDPGFQPPAELLRTTGLLGLRPSRRQHALCQNLSSGFTHYNWPYNRALVKANEAA